jgi:hypothetical protein
LTTVTLNGRLYALGGQQYRNSLHTVEVYDPNFGQWSIAASMREKRSDAGAAVLNGTALIFLIKIKNPYSVYTDMR